MRLTMESLTAWISLSMTILCLTLFTQILVSESSPMDKEPGDGDNTACLKGWKRYDRFCVSRAEGTTETAVALYCGRFGGIGIKGYCITRAHAREESKDMISRLREELLKAAIKIDANDAGDLIDVSEEAAVHPTDHFDHDQAVEEVACPKGWRHYGSLCVYKPMTLQEKCHHLKAVEFSGLCLKHADTESLTQRGLKYSSPEKEKRVCCCAHITAKHNGYGCF